jgi:Glycosyltransferase family 87
LRLFLGFIVASFVVAGLLFGRELVKRGVAVAKAAGFVALSLVFAYPVWYDLKQGNIEICVWVMVALGVWAFCKGHGYSAAACFGVAGAMKLFPLVYLGLLLARRKYREAFFGLLTAAVTTVVSVWFIGRNFLDTWRQINLMMDEFRVTYMLHLRLDEIGFDHSLFGLYKRLSPQLPPIRVLSDILTAYLATAAIAGIALYFLWIRRLPLVNQVLCLTVAAILLPPVSYDYNLMQLYVPWALLVLFAQRRYILREAVSGLTAAFVCFAILFSPESEFIYHRVIFGGQIKAVVLVVLMCVGLRYPFAEEISENATIHVVQTRDAEVLVAQTL